jgi:hypothetical protein
MGWHAGCCTTVTRGTVPEEIAMTLLDDRLISPNGLEIARFFDGSRSPIATGTDDDDAPAWDDDGLDMAYTVWN